MAGLEMMTAEFVEAVTMTVLEAAGIIDEGGIALLEAPPRSAATGPQLTSKAPRGPAAIGPKPKVSTALRGPAAIGPKPKVSTAHVSGERRDKLGRRRCYTQGKLVKCAPKAEPGKADKAKAAGIPDDVSKTHKKAWNSFKSLQGKKQALADAQKAYDARDRFSAANAGARLVIAQRAHDSAVKAYGKVRQDAASKIDAFKKSGTGGIGEPAAPAPAPTPTPAPAPTPTQARLHANVEASLKANAGLNTQQKMLYSDSAKKVFGRMSAKASERFEKHTKGYRFYADSKALGQELSKTTPDIRDAVNRGATVGGVYQHDRKTGGFIHLDGNFANSGTNENFAQKGMELPHHTYAHEFTHAVDGPKHEISNSPEVQEAVRNEINGGQLSKYATTKPSEAFAEFGRLVYSGDYDLGKIEKSFPKMSAAWKKHGIWPEA